MNIIYLLILLIVLIIILFLIKTYEYFDNNNGNPLIPKKLPEDLTVSERLNLLLPWDNLVNQSINSNKTEEVNNDLNSYLLSYISPYINRINNFVNQTTPEEEQILVSEENINNKSEEQIFYNDVPSWDYPPKEITASDYLIQPDFPIPPEDKNEEQWDYPVDHCNYGTLDDIDWNSYVFGYRPKKILY